MTITAPDIMTRDVMTIAPARATCCGPFGAANASRLLRALAHTPDALAVTSGVESRTVITARMR